MQDTSARVVLTQRVAMAVLLSSLLVGCPDSENSQSTKDVRPFLQLSPYSCSDIRNRAFLIDNFLVLIDRAGNCPDFSFSQVLYGDTTSDLLCAQNDSIGGPAFYCPVPSYADLFQAMTTHLDDPDLGLGPTHTIAEVKIPRAPP